nr:hypothetical protein [Tanacetum cinerariifolium]
ISLSFKKIYKPTNNNLRTSSNTSRANQDNSPRINRSTGYENQRIGNVARARETVEQADWRDVTDDDELEDQELEAHYMYMAQLQEVSLDAADSGPIFDAEPLQKIDQNDDDANLVNERELLASLTEKLKCEIDESKNRNKFLETSNKVLIEKLKDKELDKVIALENKVKVLDNIVYKTGQSVQTMNMLNNKCRTSFVKPEFLKKAQRANPRLYDIGFYNDNLALMLAPESDEVIRLVKESRSKLSDLIRPFDYVKLNNIYDLFVPQREKSSEQRYFSERSRLSHTSTNNGNSKESFNKQTTLIEKWMDQSILWDKKCKSSIELFKIKTYVDTIFDGVERCKETIARRTYSGLIPTTSVSRPQLKSNLMGDSIMHNNSQGKKQDVEDNRRSVEFSKNKTSVTACNDSLNAKTLNVNFVSATCDKCVLNDKHDMCVLNSIAKPLRKTVASESNQKPRNITRKLYKRVSKACSWWYPKFTPSGYKWKPKSGKENVNPNLVEIVLFIVDSGCSKYMMVNLKLLINFVEKFLGTVKFGNDQIAPILGYGDLVQGAVTIKLVYYVEGLNHNLFYVGQFCDANLEVAFRKSTCYICDLKGNDLLIGLNHNLFYVGQFCDANLEVAFRKSTCYICDLKGNDLLIGLKMKLLKFSLISSGLSKEDLKLIRDSSPNVHFLRSKDETPEVLIDFLRLVQRGLQAHKGFFTKRQLLEHLNKTELSKDGTEHLLRLLE